MKQIQQAAFGLLTLSILALLIVTGSYAIHVATDQPSLYTPPTRDAESFERKDGPGGHEY